MGTGWGQQGEGMQKVVAVSEIARKLRDSRGAPLSEVWGYLLPSNEFSCVSFGYFVDGKL